MALPVTPIVPTERWDKLFVPKREKINDFLLDDDLIASPGFTLATDMPLDAKFDVHRTLYDLNKVPGVTRDIAALICSFLAHTIHVFRTKDRRLVVEFKFDGHIRILKIDPVLKLSILKLFTRVGLGRIADASIRGCNRHPACRQLQNLYYGLEPNEYHDVPDSPIIRTKGQDPLQYFKDMHTKMSKIKIPLGCDCGYKQNCLYAIDSLTDDIGKQLRVTCNSSDDAIWIDRSFISGFFINPSDIEFGLWNGKNFYFYPQYTVSDVRDVMYKALVKQSGENFSKYDRYAFKKS